MATNTETKTCPACGEETDTLTSRTWTHYDHDSGWAYEDGERVRGEYCADCIADIDRITQAQADYEDSLAEPTLEDWKSLASRLAMGLSLSFSNWKDVAHVTKREEDMLTEHLGDNWQRRW